MASPDSPVTYRLSRRSFLTAAGGAGALLALPAALTLAHGDDDKHEDDHSDDDHDATATSTSSHDDHDDEGKVAPLGTVPAGSAEVRIVDDDEHGFQPATITVDLGQQVTFVNRDDHDHTVTGSGFDTGVIHPGEQATVTFDAPGSFAYACQIHPAMTGTVMVRDASGAVPGTPAASPAASPSAGSAASVTIKDFAFAPPELSIDAGSTVTWTNEDSTPHTATAEDGSFDTGRIDPGSSASHTFDTPGSYPYICAFHPTMHGTVIVT